MKTTKIFPEELTLRECWACQEFRNACAEIRNGRKTIEWQCNVCLRWNSGRE